MFRTSEEREEWAEDHGYYRWKCRKCGMSGWTDTTPECDCTPDPETCTDDRGQGGS